MTRPLALLALLLLAGCAAPSRGKDGSQGRLATIAGIFSEALPGNPYGAPFRDNEIVGVSGTAITWRPIAGPLAEPRRLDFASIDAVTYHVEAELPSRPEAIFIYLDPERPAAADEAHATRVPLEGVLFARPYLVLRRRRPGSAARLRKALLSLGFAPGSF